MSRVAETFVIGLVSVICVGFVSVFLSVSLGSESNPINQLVMSAFAEEHSACTFVPPELN